MCPNIPYILTLNKYPLCVSNSYFPRTARILSGNPTMALCGAEPTVWGPSEEEMCPGRVSGPWEGVSTGLLVPTACSLGRGPPPIPSPFTNVDDRKPQSNTEFQMRLHPPCLHMPCLWVSCPRGSHLQIQLVCRSHWAQVCRFN